MQPHVGDQLLGSRLQEPGSSSIKEIAPLKYIRSQNTALAITAENIDVL
jgi:hypothetical protein